jgi:imidazolonepropionase-like amidohydrolase
MELLLEAGFSLEEAVRCATWNGARLLGLESELGQLKPGMPATFIALKGSPAELAASLKAPEMVYIRGRKVP